MGKKVSSLLFRINKVNNYKNTWVFNYKKNSDIALSFYYKINRLITNIFLNPKISYCNNIYIIYGKLNIRQYHCKVTRKFITVYKISRFYNLILFFMLYKLDISILSTQFLKLFIKFNLLKYNSVQNLYNVLYTNILAEYVSKNYKFVGLKIIISGRLANTRLSNSEIFQFGPMSLQTIDTCISYDQFYLVTKYGLLGVKIWLGNA